MLRTDKITIVFVLTSFLLSQTASADNTLYISQIDNLSTKAALQTSINENSILLNTGTDSAQIYQSGISQIASVVQNGSNNQAIITQAGGNNVASVMQTGS